MPKSITRSYSRYSTAAVATLGALIRQARIERQLTAQALAERAGISRGLLRRVENGDMKCEVGVVFELAALVGVSLFEADPAALNQQLSHVQDKLQLLPKSVRQATNQAVRDDF